MALFEKLGIGGTWTGERWKATIDSNFEKTTKYIPRNVLCLSTAEINSLDADYRATLKVVYDTSLNVFKQWSGSGWVTLSDSPTVMDSILGNRTLNQSIATAYGNTSKLTTILSWFAKKLKAIQGTTNWYDAPPITLNDAVAKADIANNLTTTASGKVLDARQGKTLKDGVDTHLSATMPHQIENLQDGKTYRYGLQISVEGEPQIIYEEVV